MEKIEKIVISELHRKAVKDETGNIIHPELSVQIMFADKLNEIINLINEDE